MNEYEIQMFESPELLTCLQYYMYKRQYTEAFLAKTVEYYDSWICLKTQHSLSPYFCFRYLYDNTTDSADNWTDYTDIIEYLKRTQPHIPQSEIDESYKKAMDDRIMSRQI